MPGKVDMKGFAQGRDLEERRDTAAAGYVGLLHIDGMRLQHPAHVVDRISVFAGGNLHARGDSPSDRRETCEIIVQYAKVQPVRTADGKAVRAVQDGYISWRLPRSATKVAVPSARLASRPDPILCRRDPAAGSLINKTIQCLTAKEWGRQEDFNKDFWQELQGKGHTGSGT